MRIAIASKKRAGKIKTELFKDFGKDFFIFVDSNDFEEYNREYGKDFTVIDVGFSDKGITPVRNYIIKFFKNCNEKMLLMSDDDMLGFCKRGDYTGTYYKQENIKPEDVKKELEKVAHIAETGGFTQLGLGHSPTSIWTDKLLVEKNHCSDCYFLDIRKLFVGKINYDLRCSHFEDFDLTAQIIKKGMKTGRYFGTTFKKEKMNSNAGGCLCYDRKKMALESGVYLLKKWGVDIVKPFYSEKHDMPEVKFNWKKL